MPSSDSSDSETEVPARRRGGRRAAGKKRKIPDKSKKVTRKRTKPKKVTSSSSEDGEELPLSSITSPKKVPAAVASSSSDDDCVPLGNLAVRGGKKTATKVERNGDDQNGHEEEESDKSGGTTEFAVKSDISDAEDKKPLSSLSDSSEKPAGKTKPDGHEGASAEGSDKDSDEVEAVKKVDADGSSSDTSVYNSDPGNKSVKEKVKRTKGQETAKKTKGQKGNEKSKAKAANKDIEDPRLTKLKRCVREAGLCCVYKRLFEECQSDKERIKRLEKFFVEKGLEGPITLETCRTFRSKREEQKELAELDTKNILSDGRRHRRNVRSLYMHDDGEEAEEKIESEKSSSSEDETAMEAQQECKAMFSRLKGIVDSDESD